MIPTLTIYKWKILHHLTGDTSVGSGAFSWHC